MGSLLFDVFDDQLAKAELGDDVLQTLRHRAGYRTMWAIGIGVAIAAAYGRYFTDSATWETITSTLAVVLLAGVLVYESILALDGVLKGRDELLETLQLPRSVVIGKSIVHGLMMSFVLFLVQSMSYLNDLPWAAGSSTAIVVLFSILHYRRWRPAIATNIEH